MEKVNGTLTSPYDFILDDANKDTICSILQIQLAPPWSEAFDQCKHYREFLATLPTDDPKKKILSYVMTKADVDTLFRQNGGHIDAIRVYIGHEPIAESHAVRLFVVGCVANGTRYDDWAIPHRGDADALSTLGEARPCPDECSSDNDLNTP